MGYVVIKDWNKGSNEEYYKPRRMARNLGLIVV